MKRYKILYGLGGVSIVGALVYSFTMPFWWLVWLGVALYNAFYPVD